MASSKISQLPATTTLEGQEYYLIVQSGVTKKIEASNVNAMEKLLDVDLTGLEEGDVLIYSGGTWMVTGLTELTATGVTYTGDSDITIGGINAGDTFNKTSMQDMWFTLLHPYQNPVVSLSSTLPSTVEVGTVINSTYTFTWSTTNDSNVDGTLTLSSSGGTLVSGLTTDDNTNLAIYFYHDDSDSESVTISGVDTEANNFSDSVTTNWRYYRYYGSSSSTTINDGEILALSQEFSTTRSKSWAQDGNGQYLYYVYPSSWGDVSSGAPFTVNGLYNIDWTKTTRNVILSTGLSVEHIIYRSNNKTFGVGINLVKL